MSHQGENKNNRQRKIYCPLNGEFVEVNECIRLCYAWDEDNEQCGFRTGERIYLGKIKRKNYLWKEFLPRGTGARGGRSVKSVRDMYFQGTEAEYEENIQEERAVHRAFLEQEDYMVSEVSEELGESETEGHEIAYEILAMPEDSEININLSEGIQSESKLAEESSFQKDLIFSSEPNSQAEQINYEVTYNMPEEDSVVEESIVDTFELTLENNHFEDTDLSFDVDNGFFDLPEGFV